MTKPQVDNDLYRRKGDAWWDDDCGEFSTIRFFVNPVRYGYFRRVLEREGARPGAAVLDIGCGGGILAEEFARDGFRVTGIDPAPESIETARTHAAASGLEITYEIGSGEHLPFSDASFDHVACCDVLEHVDEVERVIGEIARVLKPGGLFFYDTVNRTCMSRIAVIKVMQDWKATAFAAPNSHVWDKFIKPRDLVRILRRSGLRNRQMRGISIRRGPLGAWLGFRRRVNGKIGFKELGEYLGFRESRDLSVSYMGYASREG
jgi:2-polyprenyl-6-hydroxyphenyl methylase / 3-demethylubiquinone-9 3-methyltransferase